MKILKGRMRRCYDGITLQTIEGIEAWAKMAWELGYINKKGWYDYQEVAASIQGYIMMKKSIKRIK
jgi:hypothetical protein